MKRIFFVCVEGFAKAKMDGDGFSLRLKTYFASSFWNTDFWNTDFWNTDLDNLRNF